MTEETKTEVENENAVSFFVFSFESKTEGLIASKLPEGETKEKVLEELKGTLGDDFTLLEFRLANEDEVAKAMFEMGSLEETTDETPPTLN